MSAPTGATVAAAYVERDAELALVLRFLDDSIAELRRKSNDTSFPVRQRSLFGWYAGVVDTQRKLLAGCVHRVPR